jgi:stage V sporulation protein AE
MNKTRVIIITDGDDVARRTVEEVAQRFELRTISASAGNPTPVTGQEIARLAAQAAHDPVLVMVDDRGNADKGRGEWALEELLNDESLDVLGVVAVASNTRHAEGVPVDESVTATGRVTSAPVDKNGEPVPGRKRLVGDTVDVLNEADDVFIVGVGDVGKMGGNDGVAQSCPVTARAVEEILRRAGLAPQPDGPRRRLPNDLKRGPEQR